MDKIKITLCSGKSLLSSQVAPDCDPFCVFKLGTTKYISTIKRGINRLF